MTNSSCTNTSEAELSLRSMSYEERDYAYNKYDKNELQSQVTF